MCWFVCVWLYVFHTQVLETTRDTPLNGKSNINLEKQGIPNGKNDGTQDVGSSNQVVDEGVCIYNVYIYTHVYICIYMCMYVCIYMYVYIYIYIDVYI